MRFYEGRFLKRAFEKSIESRIKTTDAVIVSVDVTQHWCGVKIQNSDKTIKAYYPEGWEQIPHWLKDGSVVRIPVGPVGRIEVLEKGILKPTPIPGGTGAPDPAVGEDAVLSGLQLIEVPNGTWMRIMATAGTIRISNVTYTVPPIAMGSTNFVMGMGGDMEEVAYVSGNISAPSAGTYRYDLVVIGSDLVFDIVTGTAAATPAMPDTPASHILAGWVLLAPGMTDISQQYINATFATTAAANITITIADDDLAWAELTTTITVAVKDSYGNAIYQSGSGWYITLAFMDGNGTLSYGGNSSTTSLSAWTGSSSNQIIFTYTRDQLDPGDESPIFQATISGVSALATDTIILRDASGDEMH